MIIKPLSQQYQADDAAIAAARVVRLVNIGSTEKVSVANAIPSELTILANTSVVIEKEVGAAIGATGTVLATIVAFTN